MSVQKHYLDLQKPLLTECSDWLSKQGKELGNSLDLSHILVVLPTRNAGRLLRRALLDKHPQLLSPRIESPRSLLDLLLQTPQTAEPSKSNSPGKKYSRVVAKANVLHFSLCKQNNLTVNGLGK